MYRLISRLVKIAEAAKILGTKPDSLRKWEVSGELIPARKTKKAHVIMMLMY